MFHLCRTTEMPYLLSALPSILPKGSRSVVSTALFCLTPGPREGDIRLWLALCLLALWAL